MRVIEQRELVAPFGFVRAWLSDDEAHRYALGTWFKSAIAKANAGDPVRLMVVIDQRPGRSLPSSLDRSTVEMHNRAQYNGYDGVLLLSLSSNRYLDYESATSHCPDRAAMGHATPMNMRALIAGATGQHIMQTEVKGVVSDVVCAWGGRRPRVTRPQAYPIVRAMLERKVPLYVFGLTKKGDPARGVNLPATMLLARWSPEATGYFSEG